MQTYRDQFMKTVQAPQLPPESDLYSKLMDREQDTLKILDRIVNYEKAGSVDKGSFFSMPLADIPGDYVRSMTRFVNNALLAGSVSGVVDMVKENHKITMYLGATLVMVAVVILMLEYS